MKIFVHLYPNTGVTASECKAREIKYKLQQDELPLLNHCSASFRFIYSHSVTSTALYQNRILMLQPWRKKIDVFITIHMLYYIMFIPIKNMMLIMTFSFSCYSVYLHIVVGHIEVRFAIFTSIVMLMLTQDFCIQFYHTFI